MYSELGKTHTGFYQYQEAMDAFLTALELNSDDPLLVFTIASHYDHWMNDKENALVYYRRFMETRPKDKTSEKKVLTRGTTVVSYYEFVERRIEELEKETFWNKE
jgi:tetratricopeptide (TPR) repeat protein